MTLEIERVVHGGMEGEAAARYDELIASHPEAFADHAAEFWLAVGGDANKALRLARMNLEVRKTPRACDLLFRAVCANAARAQPCDSFVGSDAS